ncbi:MAG: PAS domain S-box protein [Planctomycetota bacterium]|nr:PAS domain S-box protein [Planctomycetota bacterium]
MTTDKQRTDFPDPPARLTGLSPADSHSKLRQQAEEKVAVLETQDTISLSSEETRCLLHDLHVHQVELEMQNEELRRMQLALEASRAVYFDLYDLAPVGYVTLSENGLILQANLTAAALLGVSRGQLVKQLLSHFIVRDDVATYVRHRKQLLETGEPQAWDLQIVNEDGIPFWAQLQATVAQDGKTNEPVCYVVISDITDRKRMEEALTSENEFRAIADYAADWEVWFGTDGKMLWTNPAVERITGYSSADVLVMPDFIATMVAAEDRDLVAVTLQDALCGGTGHNVEFRLIRKNGSKIWLGMSWQTIFDAKGNSVGTRTSGRDVTERKQAEETLRRSETQLRAILESTADGILAVDDQGHVLQISRRFADLWRIPQPLLERGDDRELLDFVLHQLSDPDAFTEKVQTLYDSDAEDMDTITFKDGRALERYSTPMVMDGIRIGRVWSFRDISDRKRAAAEASRMVTVVRDSNDAITIQDFEGQITAWNHGAELMYGYSEAEALQMNIGRLTAPGKVEEQNDFTRRLLAGEAITSLETQRVTKDGRILDVWMTVTKLVDDAGKPIGIASTERDFSDRKRAAEEVHKLNAELEQRVRDRTAQLESANKELESFSYSVSHDLRAPLRHVQGYVDMLAREVGGQLSDKGRRCMKTIEDASREMGVLIDDLLTFSRMGRAEMTETMVNLDVLVQDTLRDLQAATSARNMVWKIPPLPAVQADPAMLKLVLTNLFGNAVKFTGPRDPAEIEMGIAGTENGRVILFVRDNGVGFDPQYTHQLFGVFQRLHPADEFEGTGIGLAHVRRIIARQGGRTWAEGKLNEGATFYFTLKPSSSTNPTS